MKNMWGKWSIYGAMKNIGFSKRNYGDLKDIQLAFVRATQLNFVVLAMSWWVLE